MPPSTITVLICDDTVEIRSMLRDLVGLEPTMCVLGEASNGDIAIREASRLQPDVILLDLAMPVLSGLDALPRLRQSAPAARIIVFSGFSAGVAADESLALGADAYLEKGTPIAGIIAAIEAVVAGAVEHAGQGARANEDSGAARSADRIGHRR